MATVEKVHWGFGHAPELGFQWTEKLFIWNLAVPGPGVRLRKRHPEER
jgi:hypothetical protein